MFSRTSLDTKYILVLALLAGCVMFLLANTSSLVPMAAAQGPEDAQPMVPPRTFPAPDKVQPNTHYQQCDAYEPDDTTWQSTPLVPGTPQDHAFCYQWDRDVMRFSAERATTYVVETSNLGPAADTVLGLYDAWGWRLAWDDNGAGGAASRIEWSAPWDGTFYVLARQRDPSVADTDATYTVSLAEYAAQCEGLGCDNYVLVDRGCGSDYWIGQGIRVYFHVETDGDYSLDVTTSDGTRTIWSGYLPRGTYYLYGQVGSPTGEHIITLNDGFLNPSCAFNVTSGWSGYGVQSDQIQKAPAGQAESVSPESLPNAQPLEMKGDEW